MDSKGNTLSSDKDILKETTSFYDILFRTKNISPESIKRYLDEINLDKRLSNEQKILCDKEISETEIHNVIKNLKTEKSPGCDGLTPEFYKKYWPKLKKYYMRMVKESYQDNELPYTLRKALIALLYKKGDKNLLKNYRPISLTNYDYKIICFVLANRVQRVIADIIKRPS